ncbi:copper resistance CopC/CopD family protein [Plantactinospora sp. WMMC1484]|uniref:copper resistance CopC/CopD family protein n=1 Tax=Plantactinospora sp. WMMC1484 TaxID=3404122 RepID=UPI003BF4D4D0
MPVPARRPLARLAGLAGAVLCGLLLTLGPATPARAHATLLGTDPADGAVLPTPPPEVTLTFNEPVQVRTGAVRLLDAAGTEQPAAVRTVDTRVVLTVPPELGDGSYVITWRVISADSHPVAGGFTFAVGAPSTGGIEAATVPEPSSGVRLARQLTEALGYAGVLGGAGLAAFAFLLLPGTPGGSTVLLRRRVYGVLRWSVPATVAALLVALPVAVAWQDGNDLAALVAPSTWRTALSTDTALAALLAVAGLAVALLAARSQTRRWYAPVAGLAGAALAAGSLTLTGHTRTFGPAALVLAADLLHVANAALWLGGLVGLILLLLPSSQVTPPAAATTVAAFSRLAAWLVATLAVTGVLLGWRIVQTWSALFGTGYGAALLVKVAIAALIVGIAAWNRYRLLPRVTAGGGTGAAWPALRRTVRAEAGLLAAVLAATGVLVTQSPVEETAPAAPTDRPASVELTAPLGNHHAAIVLTPGTAGVNALQLSILDGSRRPVEPVAPPELRFSLPAQDIGPLERSVSRTAPGRYEAVAEFPLPGEWIIEVSVRTSKYENPVARIPVEIP